MRHRQHVFVFCLVVLTTVCGVIPAEAHLWRDYYTNGGYTARWDVQQIPWYFDHAYASQGLPFQERAHDATAAWNNVPDGYVWLNYRGGLTWNAYEQCSGNGGTNVLRWGELTGPAGATWYCFRPQPSGGEWNITGFSITIDSNPQFQTGGSGSWYSDTYKGVGSQVDLWSALTHEFGHAIGHARHFDEAELCPTTAGADHRHSPTLCAGVWYGNDINRRTLEADDIHTMQGAYADPPRPPSTATTTTTTRQGGGLGVGVRGCDSYNSSTGGLEGVHLKIRCV